MESIGVNSQSLGEMTQHFGIVGSLDGAVLPGPMGVRVQLTSVQPQSG